MICGKAASMRVHDGTNYTRLVDGLNNVNIKHNPGSLRMPEVENENAPVDKQLLVVVQAWFAATALAYNCVLVASHVSHCLKASTDRDPSNRFKLHEVILNLHYELSYNRDLWEHDVKVGFGTTGSMPPIVSYVAAARLNPSRPLTHRLNTSSRPASDPQYRAAPAVLPLIQPSRTRQDNLVPAEFFTRKQRTGMPRFLVRQCWDSASDVFGEHARDGLSLKPEFVVVEEFDKMSLKKRVPSVCDLVGFWIFGHQEWIHFGCQDVLLSQGSSSDATVFRDEKRLKSGCEAVMVREDMFRMWIGGQSGRT
ncbi:hypothetical protein BC830DRAFT_1083262 [Chytriomyces sp. MP71]|nr:hypothetical protein BC830DRAFT_1083262 [Chytriomyces sp. MP71]